MNINKKMMDFMDMGKSVFHVTENIRKTLIDHDFRELDFSETWKLDYKDKAFFTVNESTVIAFEVGENPQGFNIVASHSDSPSFKIKPNAISSDGNYLKINTELYGGLIHYSWLDRPLGMAGRVVYKTETGIKSTLYDSEKAIAVIPSLAIHMNREVNQKASFNPQIHLAPIIGLGSTFSFEDLLKKDLEGKNVEILDFELNLYPVEKSKFVGVKDEFISSHRIDNLQSAYTSLQAFLDAEISKAINVYAIFDNEEVGSMTKQGAQSTVLKDALTRILSALDLGEEDYFKMLPNSFMVSADNAHALHPNYPSKSDENHKVLINSGPVIKYNAAQNYTTDGISGALFRAIALEVDENVQYFVNRSDERGGGTLGSISSTQVSIKSVDVGLPQLAMHSAIELTGSQDSLSLYKILKKFYSVYFKKSNNSIDIL